MNRPTRTPMTDDRFDQELEAFLRWQSEDLAGSPSVADMTARVAASTRRRVAWTERRDIRLLVFVALMGLLMLAVLAALVARQPHLPDRLMGNGEILMGEMAYDPITGRQEGVTCLACAATYPSWSADGNRFAYLADSIHVYDKTTNEDTDLQACAGCATRRSYISIAADGSRVAYAEDGQVWLVDASTRRRTQVTRLPPEQQASSPTLSPDGMRVAFVIDSQPGIWAIGTDGTGLVQLSNDPEVFDPAWSPDGRTIAYDRDPTLGGQYVYQLWLLDLQTGIRRQVWADPGCCVQDWGGPGWSPDSHLLAVGAGFPSGALWVVGADGASSRALADAPHTRPAWRPVALGDAPTASPSGSNAPAGPSTTRSDESMSACASVTIGPRVSQGIPVVGWDASSAGDGVAVVVPYDGTSVVSMVRAAAGAPTAVTELEARSNAGDQVTVALGGITASGEHVLMSVSVTDPATPLAACSDLWLVSTQIPQGAAGSAERVTAHAGGQFVNGSSLSPDGRLVAYRRDDVSGDGAAASLQLATIGAPENSRSLGAVPCATPMSPMPPISAWSADATRIAFACGTHVEVVDVVDGSHVTLTLPDGTVDVAAVAWAPGPGDSPERLLVALFPESAGSDGLRVVSIDPRDGAATALGSWSTLGADHIEWVAGAQPGFSPDRRWLLATGGAPGLQPGSDFVTVGYVMDLVGGGIEERVPSSESPGSATWTSTGKILTEADTEQAMTLGAIDPDTGARQALATLPLGYWAAQLP